MATMTDEQTITSSRHEIRIYEQLDLRKDATWRWSISDPSAVAEYSRRLGAQVKKDRSDPRNSPSSWVRPSSRVTESALRAIIGVIPSSPSENDDDRPIFIVDDADDHGFVQLLELAIACWEYDCSIHEEFRAFAKKVKEKWKTNHPAEFLQGTSTPPALKHKNPLDWMFISLVFEWHDVFTAMSVRVIIKYDPRGFPVQDNKQLPEDFRELVDEMRKQKATRTYNFVRDAWTSLWDLENLHGPTMSRIFLHFQDPRLKIDLRKRAAEDLHEQIDPNTLLKEYEIVVGKNEDQVMEVPLHQPPETEMSKLPPRTRGRGGGFSAIARMTIHSGLEASKKMIKNGGAPRSLSSSQGSEHDEVWKEKQPTMEADANNWRTKNLAGIPFSNSRFSALRSKHIYQRVQEIGSNGRK